MKRTLLALTAVMLLSHTTKAHSFTGGDSTKKAPVVPPHQPVPPAEKQVYLLWFTPTEVSQLWNGLGDPNAPYTIIKDLKDKITYEFTHQPVVPADTATAKK